MAFKLVQQLMHEGTNPSLTLKYDRYDLAPAIAPSTGLPDQTSAVHALPGNLPNTRPAICFIPFSLELSRWMGSDSSCDEHYAPEAPGEPRKADVEYRTPKRIEMRFTIN